MNKPTLYNGRALKTGDKISIDDTVGKRWCGRGIATEAVKEVVQPVTEIVEEQEEVEPNGDLSDVCDDDTTGGVLGDDGSESTDGQPEVVEESKRTGVSNNARKNKSK
jgi:hypothetical protein